MEFNGEKLTRPSNMAYEEERGIENKSGLNIIKFTFNIYELVRIYVKLEKDEEVRFIRGDFFTFMKESCELLRNIFDINFLQFKFPSVSLLIRENVT